VFDGRRGYLKSAAIGSSRVSSTYQMVVREERTDSGLVERFLLVGDAGIAARADERLERLFRLLGGMYGDPALQLLCLKVARCRFVPSP